VFVAAAHLAATASPLRPLASAVEFAVERWADEGAAAVTGDRQLARAIARAAQARGPQALLLAVALAVVAVAGLSPQAARDLSALLELAGAA
jgi:hypothetical protein